MNKKILKSIPSLLLAYLTIKLLFSINELPNHGVGWTISIVFGALLCLYITGVFAFVGFQFPTHTLLPDSYYQIKNPKLTMTIHKLLGVKYFNVFLMIFIWGKPGQREKFFDGTRSGINHLMYMTKQSEFGHVGALMIIMIISVWLISLGLIKMVIVATIINILFNLYPVILQRKHRVRIDRMSKIMTHRNKPESRLPK